jgi:hypothetical protein
MEFLNYSGNSGKKWNSGIIRNYGKNGILEK